MKYSADASKGLHDACYYEIGSFSLEHLRPFINDTAEVYGLRIHIEVTKMKNANVYVYGGQSRYNATTKIVSSNR